MMNYQRQRNRPGTAWTRLRTDRRGIALPMMAILFAVLLAFMGLVLD
jgi:Flp pilus assembly protein TadG